MKIVKRPFWRATKVSEYSATLPEQEKISELAQTGPFRAKKLTERRTNFQNIGFNVLPNQLQVTVCNASKTVLHLTLN